MFIAFNKLRWVLSLVFLVFTLAHSSTVSSTESDDDTGFSWQLDIGLAVQHHSGLIDNLDKHDGQSSLAALISGGAYYDKFFMEFSAFGNRPLTLGYTLKQTDSSQINLIGLSWFPSISESEQRQGSLLNGIQSRHSSFEVGIEYVKRFAHSDIHVRVMHDMLSRHKGHLLAADYSRPIYTTNWLILPSIGMSYLSQKSVDYYYGIKAAEATVNRAEYLPDSGWSVRASLYAERPINSSWTFFAFASYTKFSHSITNSPIVSVESGTHTLALGVLWSF